MPVRPLKKPLNAKSSARVRRTGTPASAAAASFAPIASDVESESGPARRNTRLRAMPTSTQMNRMPGKPKIRGSLTIRLSAGAARPEGTPRVNGTARPHHTETIPQRHYQRWDAQQRDAQTRRQPDEEAAADTSARAWRRKASCCCMMLPARKAAKERMPPTERSIPSRPPRMTDSGRPRPHRAMPQWSAG